MTHAESLLRIADATEIRHEGKWFLLAEAGKSWEQVGGPYRTRDDARAVKWRALGEWRSLPYSAKYGPFMKVAS